MRRVDRYFLFAAVLCLTAGVTMGMWMGMQHDFSMAPVHAHLNLLGWASLALFGLSYRAYPALARSPLAAVHFALSTPSAMLFPFGIYLAIFRDDASLTRIAAPMWMLGVLVFLFAVGRYAFASEAATAGEPAAA